MFPSAACEPVSSCKNMAPVSSPVKQSYADRADSPESIPAEGKLSVAQLGMCTSPFYNARLLSGSPNKYTYSMCLPSQKLVWIKITLVTYLVHICSEMSQCQFGLVLVHTAGALVSFFF